MKTYLSPFIIVFLFLFSCNRDEFIAPGEGLSIQSGNKVVLNANEIDYYDLSTHFIYLKGTNSFLNDKLVRDSFQVYANGEKIYSGVFHAWYMSSIPIGPAIFCHRHFTETTLCLLH